MITKQKKLHSMVKKLQLIKIIMSSKILSIFLFHLLVYLNLGFELKAQSLGEDDIIFEQVDSDIEDIRFISSDRYLTVKENSFEILNDKFERIYSHNPERSFKVYTSEYSKNIILLKSIRENEWSVSLVDSLGFLKGIAPLLTSSKLLLSNNLQYIIAPTGKPYIIDSFDFSKSVDISDKVSSNYALGFKNDEILVIVNQRMTKDIEELDESKEEILKYRSELEDYKKWYRGLSKSTRDSLKKEYKTKVGEYRKAVYSIKRFDHQRKNLEKSNSFEIIQYNISTDEIISRNVLSIPNDYIIQESIISGSNISISNDENYAALKFTQKSGKDEMLVVMDIQTGGILSQKIFDNLFDYAFLGEKLGVYVRKSSQKKFILYNNAYSDFDFESGQMSSSVPYGLTDLKISSDSIELLSYQDISNFRNYEFDRATGSITKFQGVKKTISEGLSEGSISLFSIKNLREIVLEKEPAKPIRIKIQKN